ncbi:helix-turn-helix transcriptional regulator [Formosa algae]|uniref:helix-turn-helix transcriptional regulator n=1 Tax=Formosa algae TaxID=225843 RepID=UPI000CCF5325|nr:helix-turn-helix domain-containing protein [Formosa algae]PNW27217.1 hypothetical protein BKP44_14080 [Formosa algae]
MSTTHNELNKIQELLLRIILGNKVVLTLEEACEYTGLSKSYMYKLTSLRLIPYSKPSGKLVFFSKESLDSWMLDNEHLTKGDIEREAFASIRKEAGHGK